MNSTVDPSVERNPASADPSAQSHGLSVFASTGFEPPGERATAHEALGGFRGLNLCRMGVLLRSVVLVHAALALGLLFQMPLGSQWIQTLAASSGLALPATLLWLAGGCVGTSAVARWAALRRRLQPAPQGLGAAMQPAGERRWAVLGMGSVVLWGAVCGWLIKLLDNSLALGLLVGGSGASAPLAGAALSALVLGWMVQLDRARAPADTAARLAELQSRIRPHFLFNTLNTALSLVQVDPRRAETVLEDLSELFRAALSHDQAQVRLEDEIALARRYLDIEAVRFGQRLSVQWELDPDAGAAVVPALLLQPLVENAVRHGVEPSAQGGWVRIRTRLKAGRVSVALANSVPQQSPRPGHGIALDNVRRRLLLLHDVRCRFEHELRDGVFRIHISIPLSLQE
jgi:two-component system sensor histidine kinase AlgZ